MAEKKRILIVDDDTEIRDLLEFDIASNPEFLKQGNAIDDYLNPNRVVIGLNSTKAKETRAIQCSTPEEE